MHLLRRLTAVLSFLLVSPAIFLSAGQAANLKSSWRDHEIHIDGKADDWEGMLTFPSDKPMGVGLLNDEHSLYFCLTSTDRSILRRAMMAGLTVWFEPEGSKKKFGIRFPVGVQGQNLPRREPGAPPDSAALATMRYESLKEIQIIDPDKHDTLRAANFAEEGIEAKIGEAPDRFVYELKVPLENGTENPYALPFNSRKAVKIEIETGKMDFSEMRNRARDDGLGGMRGGGGWGGGGWSGGGMRARRRF